MLLQRPGSFVLPYFLPPSMACLVVDWIMTSKAPLPHIKESWTVGCNLHSSTPHGSRPRLHLKTRLCRFSPSLPYFPHFRTGRGHAPNKWLAQEVLPQVWPLGEVASDRMPPERKYGGRAVRNTMWHIQSISSWPDLIFSLYLHFKVCSRRPHLPVQRQICLFAGGK